VAKKACVDRMDKLSSITSSNGGHSTRALMRKWFPRSIPTYSTLLCAKLWQSLWFYMQGVQEFHQYTCSFQP
jgi:hypothetical protein